MAAACGRALSPSHPTNLGGSDVEGIKIKLVKTGMGNLWEWELWRGIHRITGSADSKGFMRNDNALKHVTAVLALLGLKADSVSIEEG